MLRGFLSIVQIIVILACPMWCPAGVCCGTDIGLEDAAPVTEVCSSQIKTCSCCHHESAGDERQPASPCQDKNTCQGICGGAILEKSSELIGSDSPWSSIMTPLADSCPLGLPADPTAHEFENRISNSAADGRELRILHQSFLC